VVHAHGINSVCKNKKLEQTRKAGVVVRVNHLLEIYTHKMEFHGIEKLQGAKNWKFAVRNLLQGIKGAYEVYW